MVHGAEKGAIAALLTACLVVLTVAGCGGSSQAETLKKPEFIKQADAICTESQKEREEAVNSATEGGAEPSKAQLVTDTILPTVQQMTKELGELGAPEGDEKEVQAIIDAINSAAREVAAHAEGTLEQDVAAFKHADQLAEEYGLANCTI
jgi:hypothetical protein